MGANAQRNFELSNSEKAALSTSEALGKMFALSVVFGARRSGPLVSFCLLSDASALL
jgi:hypothetical protein